MDERERKRRGPIGWLTATLRANPYILVAWSVALLTGLGVLIDFVCKTIAGYR